MNSRAQAALVLNKIFQNGETLDTALASIHHDKAFIQELCYGVCRYYFRLDFILQQLLQKPLKNSDFSVRALLLIGLYQLIYLSVEDYAAVSECVSATQQINKSWAKGLVNAILRSFLRKKNDLLDQCQRDHTAQYAHPQWLIEFIKNSYPKQWPEILLANNQRAPMTLRVNRQQHSRADYLQLLQTADIAAETCKSAADAITLQQPIDVAQLPLFAEGAVSVQDVAAQYAVDLLEIQPQQNILDACAAPGGKTCHILEREPTVHLTALDNSAIRSERLQQNLARLKLTATIHIADAAQPDTWWDGKLLDGILLDAPCSATGVIRRHPDIKILRRAEDIEVLQQTQLNLLTALWPLLKPQGMILYVTCSILSEENDMVIEKFLATHSDAKTIHIHADWGKATKHGRQCLPDKSDGFYYAKLIKVAS